MNWEKLKTFLIILFSCINIFLLVITYNTIKRSTGIPDETIRDTVAILSRNGIAMDEKLIPKSSTAMENIQLETFSYAANFPKNAKRLDDGSFKLALSGMAVSGREVKNMLEKAGFDTEYINFSTEFKNGAAQAVELVGNCEIFGAFLNITAADGETVISGKWYRPLAMPQRAYDAKPAHITGILIDFISDPNRPQGDCTIADIKFGYKIPSFESGVTHITVTAYPSWQITLDSGEKFYYNAMTGENML